MNGDEPFERRLRNQQWKPIPPTWRDEILVAAKAATPSLHASRITHCPSWWRELFWPHPAAWAALAGIWLMLLGVRFTLREDAPRSLASQSPPSPQMRELLRQQERLFAELSGAGESWEADRPKRIGPQPRSSRRTDFMNA